MVRLSQFILACCWNKLLFIHCFLHLQAGKSCVLDNVNKSWKHLHYSPHSLFVWPPYLNLYVCTLRMLGSHAVLNFWVCVLHMFQRLTLVRSTFKSILYDKSFILKYTYVFASKSQVSLMCFLRACLKQTFR